MSTAQLSWLQLGPAITPVAELSWLQVQGAPADPAPASHATVSFLQVASGPVIAIPAAPSSVAGDATGGTTATLTLGDASGNEQGFEWQLSVSGSGSWVGAVGDANPTGPNITTFEAVGLAPATVYSVRARSFNVAGFSAWVQGADFGTDNVGSGGGTVPSNPQAYHAALAFSEAGGDTISVSGSVAHNAAAYHAALAYFEPGVDQVSVLASITEGHSAVFAYVEQGDDTILIVGSATAGFVQGGMLAELAAEYVELRSASGLFVGYPEVLQCAITATRFYAGWGTLLDPTAAGGVFAITGTTRVTMGEWAIIVPLFKLYVERESAIVIESSRVMGVDLVGRGTAEVSQDIVAAEEKIVQLAYQEDVFTIGGDPTTVAGPSIYVAPPLGTQGGQGAINPSYPSAPPPFPIY